MGNEVIKCKSCGAALTEMNTFCPNCGTKQESEITKCESCGAELTEANKFCPNCGVKRDGKRKKPLFKKLIIFAVLLAVLVPLIISAIGGDSAPIVETKPKTATIQLSPSNFSNYFYLEYETASYKSHVVEVLGYSFETGYADCQISISKKKPCELSDVILTLAVHPSGINWDDTPETVTVNVSVDGNTTKTVTFESKETVKGLVKEPRFYGYITDVSGTVKVPVD